MMELLTIQDSQFDNQTAPNIWLFLSVLAVTAKIVNLCLNVLFASLQINLRITVLMIITNVC